MKHYVPNILTSLRVLASPIFFIMYFYDVGTVRILSEVLYLFAALTDILDGYWARKYNLSSKFGAFFDPLADKLIIGTAFLAFFIEGLIPVWVLMIIVLRDIIVTAMRRYLILNGKELLTSKTAKFKTFSQFLFIGYVMFANFFTITNLFGLSDFSKKVLESDLTFYFILLVASYTLITFVEYTFKNRKLF